MNPRVNRRYPRTLSRMLSGTGIWSADLRYAEPAAIAEAAAELEGLGYSALWIPDPGGDVFGALDLLLEATATLTVATGILNIWRQTPEADQRLVVGAAARRPGPDPARPRHQPRLDDRRAVVPPVGRHAGVPRRPAVPTEHLCIAALGPKMLELARDRTAGTHPYLVTPEHTARPPGRRSRRAGGAVEQGVVLETDAETARQIARQMLGGYAGSRTT